MPWFECQVEAPPIPLEIVSREDDDHWRRRTEQEWKTLFPVETGPLAKMVWLRDAATSDLLLAFHHCLCDGSSAVAIVQELLLLLEQPGAHIGTDDMIPPVQQWAKQYIQWPLLHSLSRRSMAAAAKIFIGAGAAFINTSKPLNIPRNEDYLLHWKLDAAQSAALLQQCKLHGVTVNTALALAWLRAYEVVKQAGKFKITCPVDIRKFVPEIKSDSIFSFGVSISFAFDGDTKTPFWQKAILLQQQAAKQLQQLKPYHLLCSLEHFHGIQPAMQKLFRYGKIKNDFMFSNMGPLPIRQKYHGFEVTAIHSPTVIGPFGNPTTIITSTYDGQMDFGFVSNNTIVSLEQAKAIKAAALNLLFSHAAIATTAIQHITLQNTIA
ncbi:hypothetical protein DXN05_14460 [Deminuibacter soli]|uniref:Condensation domain-containing protein n=2 Tax=Deminuibacter soli TaxID=2291815 RepID=A0A3E1NHA9_9BACT|nr:hypothetical protein DXN05_14460 [Deminuibacter soli]